MPTVTGSGEWIAKGVHKQTWKDFTATGAGTALDGAYLESHTVQLYGTFPTGTPTVLIEGSNDGGTTYETLTSASGGALSFSTGVVRRLRENPQKIRPKMTAKGGSPTLHVIIVSRGIVR